MKTIFSVVLVFVLSGCISNKPMYLPDGSQGHNIQCNGQLYSIADCFQKAGELCGSKGYELLNREGQVLPYSDAAGGVQADSQRLNAAYVSHSGSIVHRSIFVRCK